MKISYIANIALPTDRAHGVQIMKTCEALSEAGAAVELFITNRITPIKESAFTYYGVKENFKITKLWCLDTVHLGWFGFWFEMLTFTTSVLSRTLFKKGIFFTRDEFLAFCLKLLGKRVVWEAHTGQKNIFARYLIKTGTKIITISNGIKALCLKLGGESGNIVVIPDGVDLVQFDIEITKEEARVKLGMETDKKLVIYAGSLYKWKGWETLSGAKEFLPPEIEIKIISKKPYLEIPFSLKAADVLVLPNSAREELSKTYTSPMKLFEYMASNRPIVASDVASLREVLNDSNCYFFTPDDAESLAQAINFALNDSRAREKSAQAREDAVKYSWPNRALAITKFLG